MKKNKSLIIGIVIAVIIAAVAVWYFFFKKPSTKKSDTSGATDPVMENPDTIVRNAIIAANQKVTSNQVLTDAEKEKVLYIIRTNVVEAKSSVMEKYVAGEDIVEFVLLYAQNVYNQFNTPTIKITTV